MKKLILTILLVLFIAGQAYAQDAWYEAAEASCVEYVVPATISIPGIENIRFDIDNITNIEEQSTTDNSDEISETVTPAVPAK